MVNLTSSENILTLSLYQQYLKEVYEGINKDRGFHETYGYVDHAAGYLCKAIQQNSQTPKDFVRLISWLFSLATTFEIELEESFLKRYPTICPYCLERQCVCFMTAKKPRNAVPAYKVKEEMYSMYHQIMNTRVVCNFDTAVRFVVTIYTVNMVVWHYSGASHLATKIHEEIAEVHEAYANYMKGERPLSSVSEAIADVLAWILGAWGIVFPSVSLDDAFIKYYSNGCPVCHSSPCKCRPYGSKPAGHVG